MSARFLAWYACVVLGIGCVISSAISVAPGDEWFRWVLMLGKGSASIFCMVIARVLGRLPQKHWANRSWVVRGILLLMAIVATLSLAG
jgi:hypothetical protein